MGLLLLEQIRPHSLDVVGEVVNPVYILHAEWEQLSQKEIQLLIVIPTKRDIIGITKQETTKNR